MRCEDCLAVVEEYFDGEADERTGGLVAAHVAACAECAGALEALRAEQEAFMRYDRGLEVSPALWEGVRAEIARLQDAPEAADARPHFFARLRGQLAAALGALALRPALASSLALVVAGVAVGALWLGRPTQQPESASSSKETASTAGGKEVGKTGAPAPTVTSAPPSVTSGGGDGNNAVAAVPRPSARHAANGLAVITNASAPAEAVAAPTGDVIEVLEEHPVRQDDPLLAILPKQLEDPDEIIAAAGPLGPEQKEVARHVEKAEALLRSFRNVNYSAAGEAGAEGLAYERRLSRKLLEENTSLQLEAETAGDKETRRVLSALEPFLLDISNMREKPTREEVRSIKRRMEKQEIIAALQVY